MLRPTRLTRLPSVADILVLEGVMLMLALSPSMGASSMLLPSLQELVSVALKAATEAPSISMVAQSQPRVILEQPLAVVATVPVSQSISMMVPSRQLAALEQQPSVAAVGVPAARSTSQAVSSTQQLITVLISISMKVTASAEERIAIHLPPSTSAGPTRLTASQLRATTAR